MFDTIRLQMAMMFGLIMDRTGVRGQAMVDMIVGIAVGLLVVAVIFPIAIEELAAINTENWPGGGALATLVTVLLPILAVIGVILYISGRSK